MVFSSAPTKDIISTIWLLQGVARYSPFVVVVVVVVVGVVVVLVVVSGTVDVTSYFDLLNLKILPCNISAAKILEFGLLILRVISNTNPDGAEIVCLVDLVLGLFFALAQSTVDSDKLTSVLV